MASSTEIAKTNERRTESEEAKLSILHGPADAPLLNFTISGLLDFQCQKYGLNECLIIPWTGARWTYEQLRQESLWLAKALAARGIRPGDRVGIMAGNCEQYAAVFFGCLRVGAILVLLNNTYTATEAKYALEFTECKMLFTTQFIGRHDNTRLLANLVRNPGILTEVVILYGYSGRFTTYADMIESGVYQPDGLLDSLQSQFSPHDICNLQFTSGTTGSPKAACLSHFNIINNARFIGDRMALTEDDILCCPPPLFHCFGLVLGMLATITHGGKIVYPSETFDAAACLYAINDEQCTALHGVPAMFDSIFSLERPQGFGSYRLRTGIIAGAPVPKRLMKLLFEELGMTEYTSSYGLTEASPTCFNAYFSDPLELKLNTVGYLMPHAHAKIVDRDGHIVPLGVRGELCIAGYQIQVGYWRNPEKSAEILIRDEHGVTWLHTGDEAVFHDNGTCSITGRFKDIIIRGGENIYPLEIEERLAEHDSVERAIVVGLKHTRYGEVPVAFLQRSPSTSTSTPPTPPSTSSPSQSQSPSSSSSSSSTPPSKPSTRSLPSEEDLRAWVRDKLGRHKAPAHVFWLGRDGIPEEIPLTGSGKVRKFEFTRLAEQLFAGRNEIGSTGVKARI